MTTESAPLELEPAGFRVQLLHRRRRDVTRKELQNFWAKERAPAALELARELGFTRYTRIDQVPHPNFLGTVMAGSRKFLAVELVALWTGKKLPALEGSPFPLESEEFDTIDEFHYDSVDRLLETLGSTEGLAAARKLAKVTGGAIERTSAVIGPQYQVIERDAKSSTKVTFCLRRIADQDRERMQSYWLHQHGALVVSLQPRLETRGYEQVHAASHPNFPEVASALGATELNVFEGTASLWYGSATSLKKTFLKAECQRANFRLEEDELNFVDGQRCVLVFGSETTVEPNSGRVRVVDRSPPAVDSHTKSTN
jgi:hypothetical protein